MTMNLTIILASVFGTITAIIMAYCKGRQHQKLKTENRALKEDKNILLKHNDNKEFVNQLNADERDAFLQVGRKGK